MEASAALHNDALLCLDEIGEVNEREIGEIVYSLGNGSGKGGMSRNLTSRATPQFRLLFLSTGEQTLAQIMQKAGRDTRGGQEVRLVDIEADAGAGLGIWENTYGREPGAFSDELSLASKRYYGTAIQAFLKFAAENRIGVEREARRQRDEFFKKRVKRTDSGEVGRVASIFCLIAAAGEIATRQGITGWKPNDALWGADACFRSWIDVRGGTGARDIEAGVRAVRTFIQIHDARFKSLRDARGDDTESIGERRPVMNQVGWRDDTHKIFYIFPQVFETEILAGFDHRAIAKELIARECLLPGEGKNLARRKRIPGLTVTPRFYAIHENILE
jgi:putative DNA primase/helicase